MDYLESNFDIFLQRPIPNSGTNQTTALDFDATNEGVDGQQINTGSLVSKDGQVAMDLNGGNFKVSDNSVTRVELGRLSDGSVGLILRDQNGNELIHISGDTNIIKSPDGNVEFNFDEKRILVKDDSGIPRVLIGKDAGGF